MASPGPPGAGTMYPGQNGVVFGTKEFVEEEKRTVQQLLEQKIPLGHLSTRKGAGGGSFVYVESWKAIAIANSIFGFNGWSSSVVDITPDFIDKDEQGRFRVGVTAVVKVQLRDGTFHEDVGYGMSENRNKGEAIEKAKKEAVSDARKRALRLFGNALGNSVYDREYTNIAARTPKTTTPSRISFDAMRSNLDADPGATDATANLQTLPSGPTGYTGGIQPGGGAPKQPYNPPGQYGRPPQTSPGSGHQSPAATSGARSPQPPPVNQNSPKPQLQQPQHYPAHVSPTSALAPRPPATTHHQPNPQQQYQQQYQQTEAEQQHQFQADDFPITEEDESALIGALQGYECGAVDMYGQPVPDPGAAQNGYVYTDQSEPYGRPNKMRKLP